MKNTIRQVFHSPKFLVGFIIFVAILLLTIIYPIFNPGNPLQQIGLGTFAPPGTYVSLYDAVTTGTSTFRLDEAEANRLAQVLTDDDRISMVNWLTAMDVDVSGLDISDTEALLEVWFANYDSRASGGHDKRPAKLLRPAEQQPAVDEHGGIADGYAARR